MVKDDGRSSGSGVEPTNVDLGDDLLEKSAKIPGHTRVSGSSGFSVADSSASYGVSELIRNAVILQQEGFLEEAKKVLRSILLCDPENREAKKLLTEIHDIEIKQLLGSIDSQPERKSFVHPKTDDSILRVDSSEVVSALDQEFDLSLNLASPGEMSFFSDPELLEVLRRDLEDQLGESAQDRIDLAVGFIEMGIYSLSLKLLHPLMNSEEQHFRLSAICLMGWCYLALQEPYQTVSLLQPSLHDSDVEAVRKVELFYLMGRSYQQIGDLTAAMSWYLQAQGIDPQYRDTEQRIFFCKTSRVTREGLGNSR